MKLVYSGSVDEVVFKVEVVAANEYRFLRVVLQHYTTIGDGFQFDAPPNMHSRLLRCDAPVDVGESTEAETTRLGSRWVHAPIDNDFGQSRWGLELFSNLSVKLVILNGAPGVRGCKENNDIDVGR